MRMKQFIMLVDSIFKAAESGVYVPLLTWGEAGVGKSTALREYAERKGVGYVDFRLGQRDATDLIGIPWERNGVTMYGRPDAFPTDGSGIFNLDELNRGGRDIRQAAFELVLDRKVHKHELPPMWVVMGAANPATADYEVQDTYDRAWVTRFLHVGLEPDADEWIEYASEAELDWTVRAHISEHKEALGVRPVRIPKVVPTPRGWTTLARLLPFLPDGLIAEVALGLIGSEAAQAWLTLRKDPERPVSAEAVLTDYSEELRRKIKGQRERNRGDLIRVTLEDLVVIVGRRTSVLLSEEIDNLATFLRDVPPDLAFGYVKFRFIRMDLHRGAFSRHPKLYEWIMAVTKDAGLNT